MKQYLYFIKRMFIRVGGLFILMTAQIVYADNLANMAFIDQQIQQHKGTTGVLVLDKGEESLLARAWLANHAQKSIEVQYFIWSTDNIGILATEALLRAAERGVKVRVIVDDLLIDAPDKSLLALALHPNIEICIYNPQHSVGTPFHTRAINVVTDFRGVNQRMHDKTFIVDGKVAITGGRNMADEYFDYDHKYNFRDRDILVLGSVVHDIQKSFDRFWKSDLSVPVEQRFDGIGLFKKSLSVNDNEVVEIYEKLHTYAQSQENFEPEVRHAITNIPNAFNELAQKVIWTQAEFISDIPGKNKNQIALDGGGLSTTALADLIKEAKEEIYIQSPYLVMSNDAYWLFKKLKERGVKINISTNSLASTDNLQAFSGYRNQRQALIEMGLNIYEYQPYPAIQQQLLERYSELKDKQPVFAIHAKTMVIDSRIVYIGTYNLDPRSENLNTEVGVIVNNEPLARFVQNRIYEDMQPGNSWKASEDPDQHATLGKRLRVRFWQFMPVKPLL